MIFFKFYSNIITRLHQRDFNKRKEKLSCCIHIWIFFSPLSILSILSLSPNFSIFLTGRHLDLNNIY